MNDAIKLTLQFVQSGKISADDASPAIESMAVGNFSAARVQVIRWVSENKLSSEEAAELLAVLNPPPQSGPAEAHGAHQADAQATPPPPPPDAPRPPTNDQEVLRRVGETLDKLGRDLTKGNWEGVGDQLKQGASKFGGLLKDAAESVRKEGTFGFLFGEVVRRDVVLPLTFESGKILRVENANGRVRVNCHGTTNTVAAHVTFRGDTAEQLKVRSENYVLMVEESDGVVLIRQEDDPNLAVDLEIELMEGTAVEVHNTRGNVEIIGAVKSTRVEGMSGDIVVRKGEGTLDVETKNGEIRIDSGTYTLAGIKTKNGDVVVTDTRANFTVNTVKGDVTMTNVTGKTMTVDAVTGDIRVDISETVDGTVSFRTVSGDIDCSVPDQCNCRVSMNTVRGAVLSSIELEDSAKEQGRATGRLGEGIGNLDLSTVNGDLLLRMRAHI